MLTVMWLFVVDIFASPVHLATCYTLEFAVLSSIIRLLSLLNSNL